MHFERKWRRNSTVKLLCGRIQDFRMERLDLEDVIRGSWTPVAFPSLQANSFEDPRQFEGLGVWIRIDGTSSAAGSAASRSRNMRCSDINELSIKPHRHVGGMLNVNKQWVLCGNPNSNEFSGPGWCIDASFAWHELLQRSFYLF